MLESVDNKLDKIIFTLIKGIVVFLPLFFLPWTSEYFEFNKQLLLWLVMPVAVFFWLYKMTARGELKIRSNLLHLPVLIFLLLSLASSWFSLDRFVSFFGYFGRFSDGWLGLLSLAGFYFLLTNTTVADSVNKIVGLLKLFICSSLAVAVVALLAMLGILRAIGGDLFSIFSSASFNPAGGSLLALAVYLALVAVMLVGFLVGQDLKKWERIIFSPGLAALLLDLALINFALNWAIALVGAMLIILFQLLAQKLGGQKMFGRFWLLPAVLAAIAVLFLAWPQLNLARLMLGRELPKEALLTYGQSWAVAREVIGKNPIFGSGPGSFSQDFSLYRPSELNQGVFWRIRFDKASSHFLEMLAATGLLTSLSYFLVISLVIYFNIVLIKKYLKSLPDENYYLITILFSVFILMLVAQVFFLTNTVLNFAFWLCLGLLLAFWQNYEPALFKERMINLSKSVFRQRLWLVILFFLSAVWLGLAAYEVKFFVADLVAKQKADREIALTMAIKLNPYRYNYQVSLAKFYLNRAEIAAAQPAGEKNQVAVQLAVTEAVELAKQAAVLAPNSVLAAETLAMVYRDSRPLTLGSEPWAVKAFGQALALEPSNPVLASELGKAYVNANDLINAGEYFKRALELKSDYYEAKLGLAKAYLREKKDGEALLLLEELARRIYDADVYYELGRFYYNHGQIDRAIEKFQQVLSRTPEHANSLYSLGLAYEVRGDIKEALKYFSKVLELNPGNEEVMRKIKMLSK